MQEQHVHRQSRRGHRGHTARQHGQELGPCHGFEVGAHGRRRLHAEKDVGRARERFRARKLERAPEQPPEPTDQRLDQSDVVGGRHQCGEKDDCRQNLGCQDEPYGAFARGRRFSRSVRQWPVQKRRAGIAAA